MLPRQQLIGLARRYWWALGAFFLLIVLLAIIGGKPKATVETAEPIVQTTIPMEGYSLPLPTWSNWTQTHVERGEGVNTINVGDEYAKDLTGTMWTTTIKDLQNDPKELGKHITTNLAGHGWSTIGTKAQRSSKGKYYQIEANTTEEGKNGMDGLIWSDGQNIQLVSWSWTVTNYVEKRQNKQRAEYSVFVSNPIGVMEILDAVRLRHRPKMSEE